jgi:hypothetical protein
LNFRRLSESSGSASPRDLGWLRRQMPSRPGEFHPKPRRMVAPHPLPYRVALGVDEADDIGIMGNCRDQVQRNVRCAMLRGIREAVARTVLRDHLVSSSST